MFISQDNANEPGHPDASLLPWLTEVFSRAALDNTPVEGEEGHKWVYIHSADVTSVATAVMVSQKMTSVFVERGKIEV